MAPLLLSTFASVAALCSSNILEAFVCHAAGNRVQGAMALCQLQWSCLSRIQMPQAVVSTFLLS